MVLTRRRTQVARHSIDTPRESTYFTLRDKSRTMRRQDSTAGRESRAYSEGYAGALARRLVKPGSSAPESSGFDVAIVRDGFIVELYTVLTDHAP